MLGRVCGFFVAMIVAGCLISPAAAQKLALVIGNSDYKNALVLPNPVNDAADLGSLLSRIGFSVTTLTNGTAADMQSAIAEFSNKAKGADISLVFFAGHAVEAQGEHWSIPVDGKVDSLDAIRSESVSLQKLLEASAGSKLTVILIDTARDNPFAKKGEALARPGANKTPKNASKKQSTSEKSPSESQYALIMYSTGAGKRPLDGEGRNSPFTAALMKHIETPGLDLSRLVSLVRDEVAAATKGQQIPFGHASLPNTEIVLVPR